MADYENNAFFWQKVDTLFLSGNLQMMKHKGEVHPTFRNLIYPVDYGKITDTKSAEDGVSVYAGSEDRDQITAVVVAADILTKELDVKLLVGCTDEETDAVLRFLNQTDYQKTVLIRRGSTIPSWGVTE
jgi:inorganic pyrophosphatase